MSDVHLQSGVIARPPGQRDIGEILLRTTALTEEQLEAARAAQRESGGRLGDLLVARGHVSADQLLGAQAEQLGLPVRAQIHQGDVAESLIERLPIGFAKDRRVLPLTRDVTGAVRVAVTDPLDTAPLDDLRLLFDGSDIVLELATQRTILGAINEVYDRGPGSTDALASDAAEDLSLLASEISQEPQDLLESGEDDAPIIKLVNSLLHNAVKERASDLHLEPFENELRVRFRIDNVLYEPIKPLPKALQASIVSRIKIMGRLNIAEKRLPQDGRIRLKIAGRDYDVRLSTLPIGSRERSKPDSSRGSSSWAGSTSRRSACPRTAGVACRSPAATTTYVSRRFRSPTASAS